MEVDGRLCLTVPTYLPYRHTMQASLSDAADGLINPCARPAEDHQGGLHLKEVLFVKNLDLEDMSDY